MPELDTVEDTLFVPMLGRIYASEHVPHILNDKKALELKPHLPSNIKGQDTQNQYTLMASAVRSVNMDRYIKDFIKCEEKGIIVNLGCGLETTFYRNDDNKHLWYEIDLPDVINYRKTLLTESDHDKYLIGDAFSEDWIKTIREEHPTEPILLTASGLFYYFEKEKVVALFKMLKKYGNIQIVFDTVSSEGMKRMSKYMEQVGHSEANMYFCVDSGDALADETETKLILEEPYYAHINKKGLEFITKISMKISDKCNMLKMIHMKLS